MMSDRINPNPDFHVVVDPTTNAILYTGMDRQEIENVMGRFAEYQLNNPDALYCVASYDGEDDVIAIHGPFADPVTAMAAGEDVSKTIADLDAKIMPHLELPPVQYRVFVLDVHNLAMRPPSNGR